MVYQKRALNTREEEKTVSLKRTAVTASSVLYDTGDSPCSIVSPSLISRQVRANAFYLKYTKLKSLNCSNNDK